MTIKSISFLSLLLIIITGCTKNEFDNSGNASYLYCARECKYGWAFHVQETMINVGGISGISYDFLLDSSSVKASEYVLSFSTCNVNLDEIAILLGSDYKDKVLSGKADLLNYSPYQVLAYKNNPMTSMPDPIIENRLKTYFEKATTRSGGGFYTNLVMVDYRLTPIKDMKITSTVEIGGITPGESLNELFYIKDYTRYNDFIITSTKNLITDDRKIRNISIAQYLSYEPMAPVMLMLQMKKDVTVSEEVVAKFNIELVTADDVTIKMETAAIRLIP